MSAEARQALDRGWGGGPRPGGRSGAGQAVSRAGACPWDGAAPSPRPDSCLPRPCSVWLPLTSPLRQPTGTGRHTAGAFGLIPGGGTHA